MAAQKEYTAILALGGKLQGSFGAAFGAAKKHMQTLGKAAQSVGKAFGKVFGTITRGFQLALGGMAAFALERVFQNIFGGAEQAAKDALKRTQQLTAALTANPKLQALGTEAIEGQVLALQKVSAELGKQGVVHSDHFEQASRTLALYGMGPQTIAKMLPVLGDTLVATKGVNASIEDMDSLTKGITKAIGTGQVKALAEVGIMMDKNQKKAFAAATPLERQTKLVEILTQKYKDSNAAAVDTDLGKLQRFHNQMAAFSESIGLEMIPMQAKMAEFWTATLPSLEPIAKDVFRSLSNAMGDTAKFATEIVVPGIKSLAEFFKGEEFRGAIEKVGSAFGKLGEALKPLGEAFGLNIKEGENWGAWLSGPILTTINVFAGAVELIALSLKGWGNAFNLVKTAWDETGPALMKAGEDIGKAFAGVGAKISEALLGPIGTVKSKWGELESFFHSTVKALEEAFQKIGKAISDAILGPINAVKGAWESFAGAVGAGIKGVGEALKGPPPGQRGGLYGHQYGGIFTRPHMAAIAEAGTPEAVIPLNRSARSAGLLGAAAAAIGSGGGAGGIGGATTLNFAPVVSIAGNATRETVAELDRSLRSMADDFLSQFNQAQEQQRRLAFS